jgi:hypothetical protein
MTEKFRYTTCGHCSSQPNPAVIDYSEPLSDKTHREQETVSNEEKERIKTQREFAEKLTCGVTKQNVIDDHICLCYPILIKRDDKWRLWAEIIPELISYDAYVAEIQKSGGNKFDFYETSRFRSVTGSDYNH